MAKKTNLPAGFTSKTNFQVLPGVPAGQKLNATSEWNAGIGDLADSIDENFERLTLNWDDDISANDVIALGQYIDFEDVAYRCINSYDVGAGKTFTSGNFQEVGSAGIPEAPEDGNQYARKDAAWDQVGAGTIPNLQQVTDEGNSTTNRLIVNFNGDGLRLFFETDEPGYIRGVQNSIQSWEVGNKSGTSDNLDLISILGNVELFSENNLKMIIDPNGPKHQADQSGNWGTIDVNNLYIPHLGWIIKNITTNFNVESIKTLSTDVAASGADRNLIIAAETGTTDDMIELTGLTIGNKVLLRADIGDTITVKHNDAGATIKILIQDDADFVLDEVHPLELVLTSANVLAQVFDEGSVTPNLQQVTDEGTITDNVIQILHTTDNPKFFKVRNQDSGVSANVYLQLENDVDAFVIQKPSSGYVTVALRNKAVYQNQSGGHIWLNSTDVQMELSEAGVMEFFGQAHASTQAATTKTFTATPTFDFDEGNDQQMTLTGNVTSFATSNEVGSANYDVWLINDGSVRTMSAITGWTEIPGGDTHDTAANAINLYQFKTSPDGTIKRYIIKNM